MLLSETWGRLRKRARVYPIMLPIRANVEGTLVQHEERNYEHKGLKQEADINRKRCCECR